MKSNPANPGAPCALCGTNGKLEQGHIIPQFVYRWRKKVATAGGSKSEEFPDRRLQDGPKRPMLCGRCEDAFSAYESEFARLVFHPFVSHSILKAKYGNWLGKFAVSVCWRILEDAVATTGSSHVNEPWAPRLTSCRETWKQYLAGQRPDFGEYEVHLAPWSDVAHHPDSAENETGSTTPATGSTKTPALSTMPLNHAVEMEVSLGDTEAFVYANLGPIVLFGLIGRSSPQSWRGTRINAEGKLKPREISIPAYYRDYLRSRVALHPALLTSGEKSGKTPHGIKDQME